MCFKIVPHTDFAVIKGNINGKCKPCQKEVSSKMPSAVKTADNVNKNIVQNCAGCEEDKAKNLFRRNQIVCKECEENEVEYDKKCTVCKETMSITLFRSDNGKPRGDCHECEKASGRNYRRTTTKAKEWTENNREKMSELQHNSYEKNKKEIRLREAKRRKEDPFVKNVTNYRQTVCSLVNDETNSCKKLEITSRDLYVLWLEYRFDENMTIENHVEIWQIDHVVALNTIKIRTVNKIEFEDDLDLSCLYGWYNTMPVTCAHNMKKNKYCDEKQLMTHLGYLKKFIKKHKKVIELTKNYLLYIKLIQMILDN
jgi:hypothetical protein